MRDRGSVIFLHIPKAAGTSLNYVLDRKYHAREIFTIEEHTGRSIEYFKALPQERRAQIRLLRGHMPFGLHEYLSNPSVYVTMLREPIERIISHYYYVLSVPDHYLHNQVVSGKMSLEDYVASGISTELENGQVRLLAGIWNEVDFGESTRELLERALENLRGYFVVVGLLERFDETLMLMHGALGWRTLPFYLKENVARTRVPIGQIPRRTLNIIEKYNQLDCELYEYARKSLQDIIASERYFSPSELENFVTLNKTYQQVRAPYVFLRPIGRSIKRLLAKKSPLLYFSWARTALF